MLNGDINIKISLRKNDDCKSLVEKLNAFNHELYSKLKTLENVVNELNESIKNPIVPEGTRAFIPVEKVKPICSELEELLSCFNLSKCWLIET